MKKINMLVVINCLKEVREEKGFTQDRLAECSGTSVHTIDSIEKGIYNPSLVLALTISKVLDCNIDQIFGLSIKEVEEPETLIDVFKNINRNLKNEKN